MPEVEINDLLRIENLTKLTRNLLSIEIIVPYVLDNIFDYSKPLVKSV